MALRPYLDEFGLRHELSWSTFCCSAPYRNTVLNHNMISWMTIKRGYWIEIKYERSSVQLDVFVMNFSADVDLIVGAADTSSLGFFLCVFQTHLQFEDTHANEFEYETLPAVQKLSPSEQVCHDSVMKELEPFFKANQRISRTTHDNLNSNIVCILALTGTILLLIGQYSLGETKSSIGQA